MATNPRDIFAARLNDLALEEESNPLDRRYADMVARQESAVNRLEQAVARQQATIDASSNSIVSKLGLYEEGIPAQAVNLGASLASGVGRVAGQLASAPSSLAAAAETSKLNQQDMDAYAAMQAGTATPEQVQLLNRDTSSGDFTLGNVRRAFSGEADTPLNRIQSADSMRGAARSINDAFDWNSIVHKGRRDSLSEDINKDFQANWDKVTSGEVGPAIKGIAGLLVGAGEVAINNPGAVAEYVAENIPQLGLGLLGAAGKAGMAASNVGYAADNFQKGIEKYQAENNGAYPPGEVREKMAMWAAASAAAEQVGDVALLRGAGSAVDEARKTFMQSLRGTGKATASGVGTEAATEAFQTEAEARAGLQSFARATDFGPELVQGATPAQIYEGAVIGGLVGGAMQGGISAAGTTAQGIAEATDAVRKAEIKEPTSATKDAYQAAVKANDPGKFADPNSRSFNPVDAVRILYGAASALKDSDPEVSQANYVKAAEVVSLADLKMETLKARIAAAENPDQAKADMATERATYQANIDQGIDVNLNKEELANVEANLNDLAADVKDLSILKTSLNKQEQAYKTASEQLNRFGQDIAVAEESSTEQVATTPVEEATKTINLAMSAGDRVDTNKVREILEDPTNGLTTEQRGYLSAFADARQAETNAKNVEGVNTDILYGGKNFIGIQQYRQRANQALTANKPEAANIVLKALDLFANRQVKKAQSFTDAFESATTTGKAVEVEKPNGGFWSIHKNSGKLVQAAQMEAQAAQAALREIQAGIVMKGGTPIATATPLPSSQQAAPSQATQMAQATPVATVTAPAVVPEVLAPTGTVGAVTEPEIIQATTPAPVEAVAQSALSPVGGDGVKVEGEVDQTQVTTPETSQEEEVPVVDVSQTVSSLKDIESKTEGGITVFNQKIDEPVTAENYNKVNNVAQFFTQSKQKPTDTTARPLVSTNDFLSQWNDGSVDVSTFVSDSLDEKQAEALEAFREFATNALLNIQANFALKRPDFRYKDPIEFLVTDVNGVLDADENVKTSIAYGSYSWLAENASSPRYSTKEQVNEMFGLDSGTVSNTLYKLVSEAGSTEKVVMNSIGQRIYDALGFKVDKSAPANEKAMLIASLGAHGLKYLQDESLVKRTTVTGAEVKAGLPFFAAKETKVEATQSFIAPMRNEGTLVPEIIAIQEAQRSTSTVLNKLFGVETEYKEPSLKPIKKVQETTKGTDQAVPSKLKEIIEHENSVPNRIREDSWFVVNQLPDDLVLSMIGFDSDIDSKQAANKRGTEAKNDGLVRELSNLRTYFNDLINSKGIEQPMYFEHSVWKQQRVGIATNLINPQTSKFHRSMLYRPEWETSVSTTNDVQMENFKLRVAEGLGVKTDKVSKETALANYSKSIAKPEIQAAINALVQALQGNELSTEQQQAIAAGVKAGGENMHSFDALIAQAEMQRTLEGGGTEFTTYLVGEVDGVTNGPMLSHLLMGAASSVAGLFDMLNRGGFYKVGSLIENYNVWRSTGLNQDLYEDTIKHVMDDVSTMFGDTPILGSIYHITGDLMVDGKVSKDGRTIIKTPLTAMVFGSSTSGAIDSMAESFVETVYKKIEKINQLKGAEREVARKVFVKNLNQLIGYSDQTVRISGDVVMADLMNMEFSSEQLNAIKKTFTDTLGVAVSTTMETKFASFMETRQIYNDAAQLTFQLYEATMKGVTTKFMNDLIKSGEMPTVKYEGKMVPAHDLTNEQQERLRSMLASVNPVLNTLYSKESNELNAGLSISKSSRKLATAAEPQYRGVAQFGKPTVDGNNTVTFSAYINALVSPGVAMLPMATHSTDSAISHNAVMGFGKPAQVLNVHDAHVAGLGIVQRTAQNLNRATWEAMLNYSPVTEMADSLNRVIAGVNQLAQDPEIAKAIKPYLAGVIKADTTGTIDNIEYAAKQADTMKLNTLAQMGFVDQYALEGGQYVVTDTDRQAAVDMLANRPATSINKESVNNLLSLTAGSKKIASTPDVEYQAEKRIEPAKSFAKRTTPAKTGTVAARVSKQVADGLAEGKTVEASIAALPKQEQATTVQALQEAVDKLPKAMFSPWGEIGTSTIPHDETLVKAFEAKPVMNKQDVMGAVMASIGARPEGRNKEFQKKLFALLRKTVPNNLQVKYVSPSTSANDVLEKGATNARGWFVSKGESNEVYILDTNHTHAAVNTEILLHELTHAALASLVEAELDMKKKNDKYTFETLDLINELEALRTKAVAYMNANNLQKYAPAVKNIHEFISWGMTNQGFQREVVSKVTMQSKTKRNELVQGMKAFIASIVGILFKGSDKSSQARTVNGMSVMVSNVSGLFYAASQQTSNVDLVLNSVAADPLDLANRLGTTQIFDALISSNPDDQNSKEFSTHLTGVLETIVDTLHGPFGSIKEVVKENQAMTPTDVYAKALNTGKLPLVSRLVASGIKVNDQESFVMDQVYALMTATLDRNESQTSAAYMELRKVYEQARKQIKPMDFLEAGLTEATASQAEKIAAQLIWNTAFKAEQNGSKSDYLSNFASMALGHEAFASKLDFASTPETRVINSLWDRLMDVFEKLTNFVVGKMTGTNTLQTMDEKTYTLINQLVDIEAKKRQVLARKEATIGDRVETFTRDLSDAGTKQLNKIANSDILKKSKNGYLRLAGTAISAVGATERVEQFAEAVQVFRDKTMNGRQGIATSILTEMQGLSGPKAFISELLRGTKNIERVRKEIMVETGNFIIQSFKNKEFNKAENRAVTNVFLRSDMSSLLGKYTLTEMDQLISDTTYRNAEIAKAEASLAGFKHVDFYKNGAMGLGYFLATGKVRVPHLLLNAHNIARLGGTNRMAEVTDQDAQIAEEDIDTLTTLYALKYSSNTDRKNAADVLRTEMARTDGGNGVEMIIKLHAKMKEESKQRLFEGNDALFMKGYTPEITDPYLDVVTATDAEGAELVKMGYTLGAKVKADPRDNSASKSLYVLRDGGLKAHLTGIMSITGVQAKGTTNQYNSSVEVKQFEAKKRIDVDGMFKKIVDPSSVSDNYMAPTLNNTGDIANYRYMASNETRDDVLLRDNRFDKILGTLASTTFDKVESAEQNEKAVNALKEQYDSEKEEFGYRYKEISAKSTDPELRQHWLMIPEATKQAIRETWGEDRMYVRNDMIDVFFGYRKQSLADPFKKDVDDRGAMEKLYVDLVETILRQFASTMMGMNTADANDYAKRAPLFVRRAEDAWMEIVKEAKDIIVVRSGVVLAGNIGSNLTQLVWHGVPMKDIIHHHRVAIKAATDYYRDHERLTQVQTMLESGYIEGSVSELEQEKIRLEDAVNRNPVKSMIDNGLMPTIVEDLGTNDDIYSYKSRFVRKTDKLTDRLNPTVKSVAKTLYVSQSTNLYKGLSKATQLSDFVARYTLLQHVTTRKENPLSTKDATNYVSEAFVNYDIPTHRTLQYLNDMGLVMFTKYYLRIQKVILQLFRENPARALAIMVSHGFFNNMPSILDSSLPSRLGNNPFTTGAFKYPGTLDDLATAQVIASPF